MTLISRNNLLKTPIYAKGRQPFQALVKLLNIPLRHGFAPKCWYNSVTVMIENELDNPQIKHL
jgi:hypothetical protein